MADTADTSIIATNVPANNGYGQNGYQGPASDLPKEKTAIPGFGTQVVAPAAQGGWQTRSVSQESYAPSHGMKDQTKNPVKAMPYIDRKRAK